MEEGSILGSLDRIETAIARIEAAAGNRLPLAPVAVEPADTDLEQRHIALKAAVEQALTRIDTLIGDQS